MVFTKISGSRTGRMEAKGCAKPAVWKDARRFFYWTLRARLAKSRLLAKFAEANPDATYQDRLQLLSRLAPTTGDELRETAEKLEKLDIGPAISQLRSDHVLQTLRQAVQSDRKSAVDGLLRLLEEMSEDEKSGVLTAIQNSSRLVGE